MPPQKPQENASGPRERLIDRLRAEGLTTEQIQRRLAELKDKRLAFRRSLSEKSRALRGKVPCPTNVKASRRRK